MRRRAAKRALDLALLLAGFPAKTLCRLFALFRGGLFDTHDDFLRSAPAARASIVPQRAMLPCVPDG